MLSLLAPVLQLINRSINKFYLLCIGHIKAKFGLYSQGHIGTGPQHFFLYFICLFQFKVQHYITSLQEKKILNNSLYCNNCVSYNTF